MSTLQQKRPSAAASARAGGPGRTLPALLLALALPTGGATAPALEYGPEAEARFVERCAGDDATAPMAAPCRRLMERMQAELGYEAFLEATADASFALERPGDSHAITAGPSVRPGPAGLDLTLASFRPSGDRAAQPHLSPAPLALAPVATAPDPIVAPPGLAVMLTLNAQGAQIYDCRSRSDGRLAWQFREPVATLFEGGRTVGRHYAGPSWELADGSARVTARVAGRLPGAGAADIPWLRLEIEERSGPGVGRLAPVTAILRINTVGGVADGPCTEVGALRSVAYAADYVFLSPSRRE